MPTYKGEKLYIVECRKMEENMSKQEGIKSDKLLSIVEKAGVIIFIWKIEPGYPVKYVSDNITQFGFTKEEFQSGKITYTQIIHPDDFSRTIKEVENHLEHQIEEFEQDYRIISKQGKVIWVYDRTTVIYDENKKPIISHGVIMDISKRKKLESDIAQREVFFQKFMDEFPLPVGIANEKHETEYINLKFIEAFGYTLEEVSTKEKWLNLAYPDEKIRKESEKTWEDDNKTKSQRPFNIKCKNGDKKSIIFTDVPLGEGKSFTIFHDITEIKTVEDDLLTERIKVEKLESIALLAGGIAHDFNNLLVGIMGNTSLLNLFRDDKEQIEEITHDIIEATKQAHGLTKQLLTFSKGGNPVKKEKYIIDIIQNSISMVMRGSKSKCHVSFEPHLPNVNVDEGQLNQVFNNLLINASHAMPEGGTIRIEVTRCSAGKDFKIKDVNQKNNSSAQDLTDYVKIKVIDHGHGIKEVYQKQVFSPFFTTKENGTGLGLATSYSILKKHDGNITFNSNVGEGTTFTILLKAEETLAREPEAIEPKAIDLENIIESTATDSVKQKFSVLIMDDQPGNQRILKKMLKLLGYRVDVIFHGKEAIGYYKKSMKKDQDRYSFLILDLTIPGGMGGKETLEKLREIDPNVVAIVSSGYSNDPILADYKKYGFKGVLPKPFTIEQLETSINKMA